MSLTSFLKNNADVRKRFDEEFKKPNFPAKLDMIAPPLTKNYSTAGTAFDYLLRFVVQHANPFCTDCHGWIAEDVADSFQSNKELSTKCQDIISKAKSDVESFLKTGEISEELLESSLSLATLDPILRAGCGHANIGVTHRDDVQDLKNLVSIIDRSLFTAKNVCLLNPTFGFASVLVGGADADLIIDDTLIDIKTTKDFSLQRKDFNQVIGYYILNHLSSIHKSETYTTINNVAIYFSRHKYLFSIPIEEIIDPVRLPDFLRWFCDRAGEEFPSISSNRFQGSLDIKPSSDYNLAFAAPSKKRHEFLNVSDRFEGYVCLAFDDDGEEGYSIFMTPEQSTEFSGILTSLVALAKSGKSSETRRAKLEHETITLDWDATRGTIGLSGDGRGIEDGSGAEMTPKEAEGIVWDLRRLAFQLSSSLTTPRR